MNKILQKKEVVTIGLVLSLIVIAMIPVAVADNINPGVFAVNSKPYGLSYAQWTANWWKWAMGIPTPNNPIPDKTGANCAQQQSGPVWFLAGSNGAPHGQRAPFELLELSGDIPINQVRNYALSVDTS